MILYKRVNQNIQKEKEGKALTLNNQKPVVFYKLTMTFATYEIVYMRKLSDFTFQRAPIDLIRIA